MKPVLWEELTWEIVRDMRADGLNLVLFPVGTTQQHGPHLPLNVDTLCAQTVAHAVSARTGVPVLPALPFGSASQTRNWPGNVALSPMTLALVVREILAAVIAYGFTRIVILNGDNANAAALQIALETLRREFPQAQIAHNFLYEISPRVRAAQRSDAHNSHGGAAETALLQHLAPHLVRTERIEDDADRTANLVFSYSTAQTSRLGHTGSPSLATPEMGADLFAALVDDWTYFVKKALVEKAPLSE